MGPVRLHVGGRPRVLHVAQDSADPIVGAISLSDARAVPRDALGRLGHVGVIPAGSPMGTFDGELVPPP